MEMNTRTVSRFARWTFETQSTSSPKKSEPFKMGLWTWHLSVEKDQTMYVRLYPEPTRIAREQPPIARFIIRVEVVNVGYQNLGPHVSPVTEKLLRTSEDFIWSAEFAYHGRFIAEVEFLDLKVCPKNGEEATSIWPCSYGIRSQASESTLRCFSRMLKESIYADVTINTADGVVRAHKAILSASSPVFHSMFLHPLKEKESSTIDIEDMSVDSCMAFLSYLYGTINEEDFWKHRVTLLAAANKYDIAALKSSCEESLMQDINSDNVLDRLQGAWLYQLDNLKKACLTFLFDFRKIYEVEEEINNYFNQAERDLVSNMFHEVLRAWKVT
ncbi:hypothetical protein DCAR_0103765 [Daucus carota subsp. sativus]|uniref:BTB domain-containing protein n=2 Tax=Daucus carota subsp. sativus TaxID=79200 RepID=A0AAF0W9A7_DAUCS|nr:PREDICTED: BTB/POZ domain-containing protein At1g21780 isoform X2 [Daucus carota subsp. sativus]WOG84581.1 hypothetical protein DCAR_0103765 [Daucus carota subsp. sativus]